MISPSPLPRAVFVAPMARKTIDISGFAPPRPAGLCQSGRNDAGTCGKSGTPLTQPAGGFVHAAFRPMFAAMPLTRSPTNLGHGPIPNDYAIKEDGHPVGRIYKAVNVTKDPWAWFINGYGYRPAKGTAGSLEEALAALKAEWERQ